MKLNKDEKNISNMFDEISGKYDFLNHFLTANRDKSWRRKIIRNIKNNNYISNIIADIASGTGDMTLELLKLKPEIIFSYDISEKMLEVQKRKLKGNKNVKIVTASSENLPNEDNSIDLITISFGIRNFNDLEKSLGEINRVLKPGGKLIILEMFRPENPNIFFKYYFSGVMPVIGKIISGNQSAYDYLHHSVEGFHTVNETVKIADNNNFVCVLKTNNFLKFVYTLYLEKRVKNL